MSKFVFEMSQRVIVPETKGIQGLVFARTERVNLEPKYTLIYLDDQATPLGGDYPESAIAAAQTVKVEIVVAVQPHQVQARSTKKTAKRG